MLLFLMSLIIIIANTVTNFYNNHQYCVCV